MRRFGMKKRGTPKEGVRSRNARAASQLRHIEQKKLNGGKVSVDHDLQAQIEERLRNGQVTVLKASTRKPTATKRRR